jgi:hypothetical protein
MPLVGSNPRARANAHIRWAERYNERGDHAKAAAHVSRALAYGATNYENKPQHGFGTLASVNVPIVPFVSAMAALPTAAAKVVGMFTGTGAASDARPTGLTLGLRDDQRGKGGTKVGLEEFMKGATGVAVVQPEPDSKGDVDLKQEGSNSWAKELPGDATQPHHPNAESAPHPHGTKWAKSTAEPTAIDELIQKLRSDYYSTTWDVALKLRADGSKEATDELSEWGLTLGLAPGDIGTIMDLADAVRGKGGPMPYETNVITGELKLDGLNHPPKKGADAPGDTANSMVHKLIEIDKVLIKEYADEFASQPDMGYNRNLLKIVTKRCEIANLIAQLHGDTTYTMPARGLHMHLIRVRIYIEWLDKLQNVNNNEAGSRTKQNILDWKVSATEGAASDLKSAEKLAARSNSGAYTDRITAAKNAVELASTPLKRVYPASKASAFGQHYEAAHQVRSVPRSPA